MKRLKVENENGSYFKRALKEPKKLRRRFLLATEDRGLKHLLRRSNARPPSGLVVATDNIDYDFHMEH